MERSATGISQPRSIQQPNPKSNLNPKQKQKQKANAKGKAKLRVKVGYRRFRDGVLPVKGQYHWGVLYAGHLIDLVPCDLERAVDATVPWSALGRNCELRLDCEKVAVKWEWNDSNCSQAIASHAYSTVSDKAIQLYKQHFRGKYSHESNNSYSFAMQLFYAITQSDRISLTS